MLLILIVVHLHYLLLYNFLIIVMFLSHIVSEKLILLSMS